MEIEEVILNNLKRYYVDAYNKRIHIDDIYKEKVEINPRQQNSICLWNSYNSIIRINNKCNHLLLYNCNNITIHADNFISGITCIKCRNCNILFYKNMTTNIEMSNSFYINIRSNEMNSNILYMGVNATFIKHSNYYVINYTKINDGLISEWKIKNIII